MSSALPLRWLNRLAALWLLLALASALSYWSRPVLLGLLDPVATHVTVPDGAPTLSVDQLAAQLREDFPAWTLLALSPAGGGDQAVRAELQTAPGLTETRYLNPYSGKLLARPGFQPFFQALEQTWHWLFMLPLGRISLLGAGALLAWRWSRRDGQAALPLNTATLVVHASQTGHAENLARQTAESLRAAGLLVELRALGELTPAALAAYPQALWVVSTFGDGEAPDSAHAFARHMGQQVALGGVRYGLLALGDRHYPHFCGFGHHVANWLDGQGAQALFPVIEVDQGDPAAITRWQAQLATLTGQTALPAWQEDALTDWRLQARQHLNPDSQGAASYHIALEPEAGVSIAWQAGDIVEIAPRHAPAKVSAWLSARGLTGDETVTRQGERNDLATVLACSEWPDEIEVANAQQLADTLTAIRPRAYSIASIPADGRLELLIRQIRTADGLSLGSGWLTEYAGPGQQLQVRVRSNPGFHAATDARPMILIGNGTGLASLRAHLKARALQGYGDNWLIFGERSAAHDFYYRDELLAWQADGSLARLDTAFSRDQERRIYVQDVLRAASDEVQAWLARSAAIYVCGSAAGMAPAVNDVLLDILGEEGVEALIAAGRYRRDVY
ncbi:flavodoxin domain-containing protein [Chitinimonas naiadis]